MDDRHGVTVDICDPQQTWAALEGDPDAQLVDVRTRPEWTFVGIPDLSALGRQTILTEWRRFPDMSVDPAFAETLLDSMSDAPASQLFFLCRSGARSMEAAQTVAHAAAARGLKLRCVNVAEGFEGDLDGHRHRGALNGWKHRGLAWIQS